MKYFAYCRKSSEDERRQVLSIQSQTQEIRRRFPADTNVEIVAFLEEERSAMKLGRPVFASMMARIERGEAEGIIAWAPDRLARNSIDGGRIIFSLDCGAIKDLKFCTYTFENNSQGKFMLQIMFGQSKYYSDALSENVKRGVRTKIENGWWPTIAPLGYLNNKATKTIEVDPDRFPLIRRMFDMLLSGAYSAEQICTSAEQWGLRTPLRTKLGGRPFALSTVYKIFYNPFYAGIIEWNGAWHPGNHAPMITLAEHERVRAILGRPGRPQAKKNYFAYAGLIRCGSCNFSVVGENKANRFGSTYTYYHCSWRARPKCHERTVELKNMEAQICTFLSELSLPDDIYQWVGDKIEGERNSTDTELASKRRTIELAIADLERRSSELADMRARLLIEDAEFVSKREAAKRELMELRQSRVKIADGDAWFEPAKLVLSFCNRAISSFNEGTEEEKRLVVHAVGSNLTLSGRIVSVHARRAYRHVPKGPSFPNLRAYTRSIRKMVGERHFEETINILKEWEELRAARLGSSVKSPKSTRPCA